MGTLKQQQLQLKGGKGHSRFARMAQRYEEFYDALNRLSSNLTGFLWDTENPATGINFRRQDVDRWLVVAKREKALESEVIIASGADVIEALMNVSKKMAADAWKQDTPYDKDAQGKG